MPEMCDDLVDIHRIKVKDVGHQTKYFQLNQEPHGINRRNAFIAMYFND